MAAGAARGGLTALRWGIAAGAVVLVVAAGIYGAGILRDDPAAQLQASAPVQAVALVPQGTAPEPAEPATAAAVVPVEPAVPAADVAEPKPEPNPVAEPDLGAPSFDVVRVEPDGTTLVAGSSPAGSRVSILLDDAVQHSQDVDNAGKFVSFLTLPISDVPRVLTLVANRAGASTLSEDQIILAPSPRADTPTQDAPTQDQIAPDQIATAEPAAPVVETAAADAPVRAIPVKETPVAKPAGAQTPVPDANAAAATATPDAAPDPAAPPRLADTLPQQAQPAPPEPMAVLDNVASAAPADTLPADTSPAQTPARSAATALVSPDTTTAQPLGDTAQNTQIAALTEEPEPAPTPDVSASATPIAAPATPSVAPTSPSPAPAPVTVLRAGSDGIELLQPANPETPDVMDKVALDTISYSPTGEVLLSGRSGQQSVVRVYLNNRAVTDLTADDGGRWRGQLDGVTPGIYTLRLDELDAAGDVLSRLETPFKREPPEVLNPPSADLPAQTVPVRAVTVQAGDTLWAISHERYGDGVLYVRVFEANRDNIRDPDLIYPGQVFAIPE